MPSPEHNTFPHWKLSLRSVLLFVLLGAVTALAWTLTITSSRRTEQGSALLAELRTRGLMHYWTEPDLTERWFLHKKGSDVVGWELHHRQPGEGDFSGGTLVWKRNPDHLLYIRSRWELAEDARTGIYLAEIHRVHQRGPIRQKQKLQETQIRLDDGLISVVQNTEAGYFESTRPVPANYVPEGTLELLRRLVAAKQTEASFKMVLDPLTPPKGSTVTPLISVDLAFAGPADDLPGACTVRQTYVLPGQEQSPSLYTLDADGHLLRIREGDLLIEAASRQDVASHFPELQGLLESHEPLTTP